MKTLILTPNRKEMCGMYQLAKDLAKEFDGIIMTKGDNFSASGKVYNRVITFLYPMHSIGESLRRNEGIKWICYDQGIPPIDKFHFPNFFRRMYMRWFKWRNDKSKAGADEYWDVTKRPQKPRWTEKAGVLWLFDGYKNHHFMKYNALEEFKYALYVGRKTDYKNFNKLDEIMDELKIPFVTPPDNCSDKLIHLYYSNASLFVTASTWEGYGRPVMEAQALEIPVVCFDTGVHKKLVKKGFVVPNYNFGLFKQKLKEAWKLYSKI